MVVQTAEQQRALDTLLAATRLDTASFGRLDLAPPWGGPVQPGDGFALHHVVSGAAFLHAGDGEPIALSAGDVILVDQRRQHALSDRARPPGPSDADFWNDKPLGERGAAQTVMLCAVMMLSGAGGEVLAEALPSVVHVPSGRHVLPAFGAVLDCIDAELRAGKAGSDVVLTRLAEVLLLQVAREAPPPERGLLAGLTHPGVAKAVAALFDAPAEAWTVAELARRAGMSRSAFAAAFRDLVGEGPIAHLTRWRMAIARELLRDGLRLAEVAARVGYHNEAAFGTAFRRHHGASPGVFRRARSGGR